MRPAFESEKHGYNKRQVDEYIDKIRAENKQITLNNDQLFLLWITELNKMASTYGNTPGNNADADTISWGKLHTLLEKSLNDNRQPLSSIHRPEEEFTHQPLPAMEKTARKRSRVTGFIFYAVIIAVVLSVYFFSGEPTAGPPRTVAGFAAMTVLSRSMQNEIPQDSLIIIRETAPEVIQIGDDITFLVSDTVTVTHRVIDIFENFADTGRRGFQTQGTNNPAPDSEIVLAENVIGRVIFHSLLLGEAVDFIRTFAIFIVIFIVLITALVAVLRMMFSKDKKENTAPPGDPALWHHHQP